MSGDFSFPTLPPPQPAPAAPKPPLTAQSTVVHAGAPGSSSAAPAPAAVSRLVRAEGRRNKVPLEKGFSQVDWLRLARSGKDLTGGAGRRREIPLSEVAAHRSADDAWMVLQGRVYNLTPYLAFHPGGVQVLMAAAGRDGTALFQRHHPWVNGHALLEPCLLGRLQAEQQAQPSRLQVAQPQSQPQPQAQAQQDERPGQRQGQPQQEKQPKEEQQQVQAQLGAPPQS